MVGGPGGRRGVGERLHACCTAVGLFQDGNPLCSECFRPAFGRRMSVWDAANAISG